MAVEAIPSVHYTAIQMIVVSYMSLVVIFHNSISDIPQVQISYIYITRGGTSLVFVADFAWRDAESLN